MAEKDFFIKEDTKINFVKHHSDYCSLNRSNPTACNELGDDSRVGGLKFISRVISASIKIDKRLFINYNNENIPNDDLLNAWLEFKRICNKHKSTISGKYKSEDSIVKSLTRAIFNTYYYKIEDEYLNLISQFKDIDELLKSSAQLIASSFGFTDWEYIYNYEESPF